VENHGATYRGDEQLLLLLHEPADWFVTAANGEIIFAVASPRTRSQGRRDISRGSLDQGRDPHSPGSLIISSMPKSTAWFDRIEGSAWPVIIGFAPPGLIRRHIQREHLAAAPFSPVDQARVP
jgi:hypothetical protein